MPYPCGQTWQGKTKIDQFRPYSITFSRTYSLRHIGAYVRLNFDGTPVLYYGTRDYTSTNAC